MSREITVDQARAFFEHPSQRLFDLDPADLPSEGFVYIADGPVCGVFHRGPWPGVWFGHYGVKPEGFGATKAPARRILGEFMARDDVHKIIGWTDAGNRAALAFNHRIGFRPCGEMTVGDTAVVMQELMEWA